MNRLAAYLNQIWFPTMPATRLAFLRIAAGLFAFWYLSQRYSMYLKIAASDPFYFKPLGAVWWMREPLGLGAFELLMVLTLLANVLFVLGWHYRITGPAFSLLLLILLSYRNSWTMIYHSDNAMVLQILILGFVGAAEAWSVDAWRKQTAGGLALEAPHSLRHWRFGWPVQLICAVTAGGYFLSAVAKIAGDLGWNWVSGLSLRSQVAADAMRKALLGENVSEMAFFLYEHLWIFTLIGVVSMIVELGAPLALLHRRAGMLWALNAFCMHWGIYFVMSITFRYQMAGIIFLAFFPVERLVPLGHRLLTRLFGSRPETEQPSAALGGVR